MIYITNVDYAFLWLKGFTKSIHWHGSTSFVIIYTAKWKSNYAIFETKGWMYKLNKKNNVSHMWMLYYID